MQGAVYLTLISRVMVLFLKPQLEIVKPVISDTIIEKLQREQDININEIEKKYKFDISQVEGKWPGDEPVEQLLEMLNK